MEAEIRRHGFLLQIKMSEEERSVLCISIEKMLTNHALLLNTPEQTLLSQLQQTLYSGKTLP